MSLSCERNVTSRVNLSWEAARRSFKIQDNTTQTDEKSLPSQGATVSEGYGSASKHIDLFLVLTTAVTRRDRERIVTERTNSLSPPQWGFQPICLLVWFGNKKSGRTVLCTSTQWNVFPKDWALGDINIREGKELSHVLCWIRGFSH